MDTQSIQGITELCLMWIGFGTVCGLVAKIIMPGRDPGGAVVTIFLGIGGALLGSAVYTYASGNRIRGLITPLGFGVAIGGALFLLIAHRLLSGRYNAFRGGPLVDEVIVGPQFGRRRRRTVRDSDIVD